MLTHKDDKYWHKSLECVFEEINDQAQDSVSLLRQLRPDVIRELHQHPSSTLHGEILRFIDENCGPVEENTTIFTCTWAKIHSIVMVLNRNSLVLDSSEHEDVKSEDETEMENENEPRTDEYHEQEEDVIPIDHEIENNKTLDLLEDESIDGSLDYFVEELERMELTNDTV